MQNHVSDKYSISGLYLFVPLLPSEEICQCLARGLDLESNFLDHCFYLNSKFAYYKYDDNAVCLLFMAENILHPNKQDTSYFRILFITFPCDNIRVRIFR